MTVKELLADPTIEIVLNLTIPAAHGPVTLAALKAGKHVYLEKPLAINRDQARSIAATARAKRRLVGAAPDTFLGRGIQTARAAIDAGRIGRPVAFTAFMMGGGPEGWHPNPQFFYQPGGGPMLDMGPYYLTALLNLFGPVAEITGTASIARPRRTIGSQPHAGEIIRVTTPDHICGTMRFRQGAVGSIITSFAAPHADYDGKHPIRIFGDEATLAVPDPNRFDGTVLLRPRASADWQELAPVFPFEYGRSVGLADMAESIRLRRPPRAGLEQAMTVLDLMLGFLDSSKSRKSYIPKLPYRRSKPMPIDGPIGQLKGE